MGGERDNENENGECCQWQQHRREKAIQQLLLYSKTILSTLVKRKFTEQRWQATQRKREEKNNTQRLKAQYTCEFDHSHATGLIYRHTCNMVDKTHRNFAIRSTFFFSLSIYLTSLFFRVYLCMFIYIHVHSCECEFMCMLCCCHPNTIPHRSAKIATNTRKTKEWVDNNKKKTRKKNDDNNNGTRFENAKAMCPLCLDNTIVVKRTNNRKKITLPERKRHSLTHSRTYTHNIYIIQTFMQAHTKTFKSRKIVRQKKTTSPEKC